jgi:hypothetical protein
MQPDLHITRATQLTIYLDNRHGTFGALAAFLGRNGVNIYGLSVAATGEGHGHARLIVSDTEKARQLIEDSNELVAASEVLLVHADNTPGVLGRILQRMAEAQINIEYAYVTGGPADEKGIVLCPSDIDTALATLGA